MPLYMDIHTVPGVKARDVAEAHRLDLLHQKEYGCNCMTYWIDEARESVFCLIEAPDKDSVQNLHHHSHGLEPNKVIEVDSGLVASFLGRIFDPEQAQVAADGLKVFHDPSYRIILMVQSADPALLRHRLGTDMANALLGDYHELVRGISSGQGGREVEHRGRGIITSFMSVSGALVAAARIIEQVRDARFADLDIRMAMDGGEPVDKSNDLFGDTIRFAGYLSRVTGPGSVGLAAQVKAVGEKELIKYPPSLFLSLTPTDEELLRQLFGELESRWTDPEFDLDAYCKSTALSRSKLYRKCIQLTGSSPNQLLKDHRLDRALELLREQRHSIAQVTFETGFTSPSYFTKCFKERFGLLPLAYSKLS